MGNPLSKYCVRDTTLPKKKTQKAQKTQKTQKPQKTPVSGTDSSAEALAQTDGVEAQPPVAPDVTEKDDIVVTETNKPASALFQRMSKRFSVLGNTVAGRKTQSIEHGLKTFPFPLTGEEKKFLIENEIPASEIKKLSIGVDVGGMGTIHMAEWKGQKVAIKEASADVEIYSRMKGCESVVPFYGVTYPPGLDKMCIVTKYADKGSLTWHLKVEYQNLTWDDKLRLATQISTGIADLHQKRIYHRDLHGGNILIDGQGKALLTDFGASRIMEYRVERNIKEYSLEEVPEAEGRSNYISKKITGLDSDQKSDNEKADEDHDPLIGIMAYIAPERFRNPKHFDAGCDIYSLGVLLWELTTGHSAFSRVPQDVHLAVAIMNGKRELPVEGTPAEYIDLYEKCWQTDPALRPSMDEILASLAKVRASMTPEQLAVTRTRDNTRYESGKLADL
ncbi:kinase-like domain-containing protein [Dissophora ornata]|nr:kinase-like domain-containing protein [Dissophora ornata]